MIVGNRPSIFQSGLTILGRGLSVEGIPGFPVVVLWQNTGNSIALHATSEINFKQFDSPIDKTYGFPQIADVPPAVPQTIGPKGQMSTGPLLVPLHSLKAIQNKTGYGYIWGWVKYGDQLDRSAEHLTQMCMQIVGVDGDLDSVDPKNVIKVAIQACPLHNCLDEDCKKQ